jgi:hypothetical protein
MSDRLLSLEEIDKVPKARIINTEIPIAYKLLEAQDAKTRELTLKEMGEWLYNRLSEDISNFTQGFITLGEIESLRRGEMPNGSTM